MINKWLPPPFLAIGKRMSVKDPLFSAQAVSPVVPPPDTNGSVPNEASFCGRFSPTSHLEPIIDLFSMVRQMRVLSMPKSVACADNVMRSIIETYFTPSRTMADIRELAKTGGGVDPLKDFAEAAREEQSAFAIR
jgi:hypothetical protein